jgi:hypothetical protein
MATEALPEGTYAFKSTQPGTVSQMQAKIVSIITIIFKLY